MICIYCFFIVLLTRKKPVVSSATGFLLSMLSTLFQVYNVVTHNFSILSSATTKNLQSSVSLLYCNSCLVLFSVAKLHTFFRSPNSFQIFFAPKHDFSLKQCALSSFCHTQMALHRPECWSISAETELHFGRWAYAFRPKLRG